MKKKNLIKLYQTISNSIKLKYWITKSGYKIIQILGGRSNVFLLTDGKVNLLIDTSISFLWNTLQKRLDNLNIKSIDYLIITHAHFDHTSNSCRIKEKYNACVIIQRNEAGYLLKGNSPIPKGTTLITKPMVKFLGRIIPYSFFGFIPCNPDLIVDDHYDLKNIGINAYLLNTPGHTLGSLCVIVDDEIAIVGDTMFGIFKGSIFPPFANDEKLLIESWGHLLDTNCYLFLPSHGAARERSVVAREYRNRTPVK